MTFLLKKEGILLLANLIILQSTIIQEVFGYPMKKEFDCGKYLIKCSYPTEYCDGDACHNCFPECKKPYSHRWYGCEDFCNKYDKPASSNAIQCPIIESSNAEMASSCSRDVGSSCDIKCKSGYEETKNRKTVWCLPSGNWTQDNQDINTFCQKERDFNWNILKYIMEGVVIAIGVAAITLLIFRCQRKRKRNGKGGGPEEKIGLQTDEEANKELAGNEEENAEQQLEEEDKVEVTGNEEHKTGIQEEDTSESAVNQEDRSVHHPDDEDDGEFAGGEESIIPSPAFNICKNTFS